jgi:uncharacterized repeat protein (TIGR01451 family)
VIGVLGADPKERRLTLAVALLAAAVAIAWTTQARGEQAGSEQRSFQHGLLGAGAFHTCALLDSGRVRCWGSGSNGKLGYGNTDIGDDEHPGSVGPVDAGRPARAIAVGESNACAVLDDGSLRCWGANAFGQLGYPGTGTIGDDESPASAGPVDLGAGRSAHAIGLGDRHACALLDDGSVRCWGEGGAGRLGYGNANRIGDDETPGSVGPVDLGAGRSARAISLGNTHTCAILDNGLVRCWGPGFEGRLGYGNTDHIGDTETPGSVGPVDLGAGRTARAISAGAMHTCALLDNGAVRCWGDGADGKLGYGNTDTIGDNESAAAVGTVSLGPGRSAQAIAAGSDHTCALLDDGTVRCWGAGPGGALGYGNTNTIGDDETPGSVGPVNLGAGRSARAIATGNNHTCALLDDGSLRCWGANGDGRLGYGNTSTIGDNEVPATVGPVNINGLVAAAVGDLSLGMSVDAPARQVGEQATFTLTLTNGGPDATGGGVAVGAALPAGLSLVSATATQGGYDAATATWHPGPVASASQATLTLVARVDAAGALTTTAEVLHSGVPDPDSTPGNGVAGEDDRASATVNGTALPDTTDRDPPSMAVTGVRRKMKLRRFRRGVRPTATPDEPAAITFELLTTARSAGAAKAPRFNLTLDRRGFPLAAGRRTTRLKPPRRLLGRSRRFRARVRVTAIDAAGNRAVVNRNIRVRR